MIDYDKLKKCCEYAGIIAKSTGGRTELSVSFFDDDNPTFAFVDFTSDAVKPCQSNIDDIITELEELTQPKPKYEVGSTWWHIDCDEYQLFYEPKSLLITEENQNLYREDGEWYPTKQSLIEAQIEHWKNEYNKMKCRHGLIEPECSLCSTVINGEIIYKATQCPGDCEWDGALISRNPNLGKCKKCGETCFIALSSCYSAPEATEEIFTREDWIANKCGIADIGNNKNSLGVGIKQDETDSHGCQHEWDGITITREKNFNRLLCKKCDEYWDDEIKECQHESDGEDYCYPSLTGGGIKYRCKKCGAFYK